MKPTPFSHLFTNPIVLGSIALVAVISVGSGIYYVNATRVPQVQMDQMTASTTDTISASGTVEPAENPDLAFVSPGRVVSVRVSVGQKVARGETLASLDTGTLVAQRAQAQANVDAAQARLAQMLVGARQEDVAAKQTAVQQSQTSLANLYITVQTNTVQAYDRAFSGLSQNTDALFSQANTSNPTLVFSTTNSQSGVSAATSRTAAQTELATWQNEINALPPTATPAQVSAALTSSLAHLAVLRTYADQLLVALSGAVPSSSFTQASVSSAQASVGGYRDTINSLVTSLQSAQQQIATAQLTVQSATDALNQVKAGSTPEELAAQRAAVAAAQASVASFNAQIANEIITAPFAGTVASVHIKPSDIVGANTPALSLNPESALQIAVYFSERDITRIRVGENAQVTLDAYSDTRVFPAQVVSVDSAPTTLPNDAGGYKATLQFLQSDPAIASGMTANIILAAQH